MPNGHGMAVFETPLINHEDEKGCLWQEVNARMHDCRGRLLKALMCRVIRRGRSLRELWGLLHQ